MKSHFSFFNQIGFSQNFAVKSSSKSLLSLWKEVHKRKKKRKFSIYLSLLRKQKRKACKLQNFQFSKHIVNPIASNEREFDQSKIAHSCLFKKSKLSLLPFFPIHQAESFEAPKSIRHDGYNVHGEMIWHHSKKYMKPKL